MKLTFYMRASYGSQFEDLLIAANEGRPKEQRFSDISDFERSVIRGYVLQFIDVYRKWESDAKVRDPRTGKEHEVSGLKFKEESVTINASPLEGRTFKRVLHLGEKQIHWLKRSIAFYGAVAKALNEKEKKLEHLELAENRAESVGDFVRLLLEDQVWRLLSASDKKEIEEESKK